MLIPSEAKQLDPAVLPLPSSVRTPGAADPERLIDEHYERVRAYVRLRIGERDCEDVAADVFLRAVQRIGQVSGDPAAWLFSIARSRVADHYRAKAKESSMRPLQFTDTLERPASAAVLEPLAALERSEFCALLQAELALLSELERDVIAFKFSDGLSNLQIAGMLNLTPVNLGVILHRALKKLRAAMLAEAP